jgi:hypothetical protein
MHDRPAQSIQLLDPRPPGFELRSGIGSVTASVYVHECIKWTHNVDIASANPHITSQ